MTWHKYPDECPTVPDGEFAVLVPVCFVFDGMIITDMGEYRPRMLNQWVDVDGLPISPVAWYELPEVPGSMLPPLD